MSFSPAPVPIVVDASIGVAVAAEDDVSLLDRWEAWERQRRLRFIPPRFRSEVANALLTGKRTPGNRVVEAVRDLEASGLEVIDRGFDGLVAAIELAERHRLSVYDAEYLWLAIDLDAELATRDRALIRAAEAEGVPLIAV